MDDGSIDLAAGPMHLSATDGHLLLAVLSVAVVATGVVVALSLAAFARRRSLSYFLVTVALAALLVRALVGLLTVDASLAADPHHVAEHGLDAVSVVLLLGAVYFARRGGRREVTGRE